MSERDELIAGLRAMARYEHSDVTQAADAADMLERDGAELERLRAEVERLTRERDDPGTTHADGCASWGPKHYACALARLEAWERASQEGHPDPCTLGPLCPYCEIVRLQARVEAAERDAGRYRWLRNESLHRLIRGPICIDADTWGEPVMACGKHITLDGATLDAAIDAAMEGGK